MVLVISGRGEVGEAYDLLLSLSGEIFAAEIRHCGCFGGW